MTKSEFTKIKERLRKAIKAGREQDIPGIMSAANPKDYAKLREYIAMYKDKFKDKELSKYKAKKRKKYTSTASKIGKSIYNPKKRRTKASAKKILKGMGFI